MKTRSTSLADAFEHFLESSSFAPLLALIGQQPVTALTAEVIQSFLAHQEALAPATYNRRLAALRSFTQWLGDQGGETSALLDGRARKPEGRRPARALDAQKVESVLRKIEDPRDRALFWLIYDGGLRSQEALSIDIEDISWTDRAIRLHGDTSELEVKVSIRACFDHSCHELSSVVCTQNQRCEGIQTLTEEVTLKCQRNRLSNGSTQAKELANAHQRRDRSVLPTESIQTHAWDRTAVRMPR